MGGERFYRFYVGRDAQILGKESIGMPGESTLLFFVCVANAQWSGVTPLAEASSWLRESQHKISELETA
jgi:hypothetical protein